MNFVQRFKNQLANIRDEEDEDYETTLVDVEVEAPQRMKSSYDDYYEDREEDDIKSIRPDVAYDIILAHPKTVDDAPDIVGNLRVNHVCIVNLEGVEIGTAQRVADFLGGASYAMNGSIERVNENIFVMAPLGVNIKDMLKRNEKANGIFSWVTKAAARY